MPKTGMPASLAACRPAFDLRRIDVDDDRVDLLVDRVLDAADHGRDVARGVDDVDVPAVLGGRRLEALDVELGAGLGEIGRDHRDLRSPEAAPAHATDGERQAGEQRPRNADQ